MSTEPRELPEASDADIAEWLERHDLGRAVRGGDAALAPATGEGK